MATLTLKIKLQITDEQKKAFDRTSEQYTDSFNRIADIGWNKGIKNGVELHKLSYESERAKTNLPSQLVCSARMKASECLKSAFALQKKAKTKVGKPNSKHCPIRYDARSATIKLAEGKASLVTIDGRQKVTFHLAKFQEHRKDWKVCSSDLCQKNGAYFLHVVVESKSPDFECSGKTTGIDLGILDRLLPVIIFSSVKSVIGKSKLGTLDLNALCKPKAPSLLSENLKSLAERSTVSAMTAITFCLNE